MSGKLKKSGLSDFNGGFSFGAEFGEAARRRIEALGAFGAFGAEPAQRRIRRIRILRDTAPIFIGVYRRRILRD